jgi:RNA polymerase sigma-70 factor, ECF subfamily
METVDSRGADPTAPVEKPTPDDDLTIVARVIAGEVQAFTVLVRRYNQRLFRLARGIVGDEHEALDVLQEAYVRAFSSLGSFRGPDGFAAWLHVIVRNEAFSQLRKRTREQPTEVDAMETIINAGATTDAGTPEHDLHNQRLAGALESAIDQLPAPFRVVFVLRAVEGLSVHETAELLELNEKTVKTRLFRAKRLLRTRLERRFSAAGTQVYEFAGSRCDRLTAAVMERVLAAGAVPRS